MDKTEWIESIKAIPPLSKKYLNMPENQILAEREWRGIMQSIPKLSEDQFFKKK